MNIRNLKSRDQNQAFVRFHCRFWSLFRETNDIKLALGFTRVVKFYNYENIWRGHEKYAWMGSADRVPIVCDLQLSRFAISVVNSLLFLLFKTFLFRWAPFKYLSRSPVALCSAQVLKNKNGKIEVGNKFENCRMRRLTPSWGHLPAQPMIYALDSPWQKPKLSNKGEIKEKWGLIAAKIRLGNLRYMIKIIMILSGLCI